MFPAGMTGMIPFVFPFSIQFKYRPFRIIMKSVSEHRIGDKIPSKTEMVQFTNAKLQLVN